MVSSLSRPAPSPAMTACTAIAARVATRSLAASAAITAIVAASALSLGCDRRPPPPPPPAAPAEEKWSLVTSDMAPLLGELEDDDDAEEVIRRGELVKIMQELREFHWDAKMEGVEGHRKGM